MCKRKCRRAIITVALLLVFGVFTYFGYAIVESRRARLEKQRAENKEIEDFIAEVTKELREIDGRAKQHEIDYEQLKAEVDQITRQKEAKDDVKTDDKH
jgi:septal ring factor EnvC (AmiA/AmiB activator)